MMAAMRSDDPPSTRPYDPVLALSLWVVWAIVFLVLAILLYEQRNTRPLQAVAKTDLPAFTILQASDITIIPATPPVSEEAEASVEKTFIQRITLHRLAARDPIDSDTDVGPTIDGQYRVTTVSAADPLATLRVGDITNLVMVVHDQTDATPQSTQPSESIEDDSAALLRGAIVLQIGKPDARSVVPLVIAVPDNTDNAVTLEQHIGRSIAYPVYSVNE